VSDFIPEEGKDLLPPPKGDLTLRWGGAPCFVRGIFSTPEWESFLKEGGAFLFKKRGNLVSFRWAHFFQKT